MERNPSKEEHMDGATKQYISKRYRTEVPHLSRYNLRDKENIEDSTITLAKGQIFILRNNNRRMKTTHLQITTAQSPILNIKTDF